MLIDRVFKKIGLNGRAVIPLVLGFGCDTMATVVTRTLETRRERLIATLLLALAIPCSAQMGLILAVLAVHPLALALWACVIVGVFLLTGTLAARLLPGERPSFYMELPPLRWPRLGNVLVKTYTRLAWYFKEILPMFILISVVIWLGNLTGLFQAAVRGLGPVMESLGLPVKSAEAMLFGFFRRDYGAAGLYDLHNKGLLSGNQLAVAAITLTLFLPCVAQFLVMKRERGWKATLLISAFICVVAYSVGLATHGALTALGVQL
jgi:ferrous iron transport protein B